MTPACLPRQHWRARAAPGPSAPPAQAAAALAAGGGPPQWQRVRRAETRAPRVARGERAGPRRVSPSGRAWRLQCLLLSFHSIPNSGRRGRPPTRTLRPPNPQPRSPTPRPSRRPRRGERPSAFPWPLRGLALFLVPLLPPFPWVGRCGASLPAPRPAMA
ncbi:MAG: hypothetical protein J3K34DRAFT_247006 [Monoraphidium minutum]|nr:MAG: hypothetical protein J3K34DRAFT_247006 [Monoraphidium minutum]